eukprot:1474289-Pleurochrysis_carterae.AAC.1
MSCSISIPKCICHVPRRILLYHHFLLLPFPCCQRPRHPLSDHCRVAKTRKAAQNHRQDLGRDEIEDARPLGGTRLVVAGACLGDEACAWAQGQTWQLRNQTTHRAGQ